MKIETKVYKSFARVSIYSKDWKQVFATWHWNEFQVGVTVCSTFFHLHLGFLTLGFIWKPFK